MCFVWIFMYVTGPLVLAFPTEIRHATPLAKYFLSLIDISLILNFVTSFMLGYHVSSTKEIVLVPKKIVLHYLRTYCFVDFVVAIPTSGSVMVDIFNLKGDAILFLTAILQAIGFLRLGSMLVYFRQITLLFRVGDTTHEFICLVLMSFFFFHWLACFAYLVPSVTYIISGSVTNSSWTVIAQIPPNSTDYSLIRMYGESLLLALCYFLAAGYGEFVTEAIEEIALFCIIYIIGTIYMGYMVVMVIEMVRSSRASENKYEEVIYQLNMYMRNKQLPHDLRRRLNMYYRNRFQMRYFRETAILATLSEHQRNELFLYSCKELIDRAKLFQGIPKTVVGVVMGALKQEVYLPNDVILKAGSTGENMFFIDKGTVAEMLATGKEVRHLEDGEHFGEMPLILPETRGKRIVNYVAIEITECFRLEKKQLMNCMVLFDEFAERLTKEARDRYELLLQMEDDEDFIMNRRDVLYDLRSGKILEKPRPRASVEK